jgi:hypothetical protein
VPGKSPTIDPPVIAFRDAAAFEAWLERNADRQSGVWLKIAKKASGLPSLTDDEAVDVGLCYGWISGQRKSLDQTHYLQKYVPRRPGSRWSKVNVAKVAQLTAAGRLRPRGLTEVEAAREAKEEVNADKSRVEKVVDVVHLVGQQRQHRRLVAARDDFPAVDGDDDRLLRPGGDRARRAASKSATNSALTVARRTCCSGAIGCSCRRAGDLNRSRRRRCRRRPHEGRRRDESRRLRERGARAVRRSRCRREPRVRVVRWGRYRPGTTRIIPRTWQSPQQVGGSGCGRRLATSSLTWSSVRPAA